MSRLPQLVYETKKDLEKLAIVSSLVGHAGDGQYPHIWHYLTYLKTQPPGNFHTLLLFRNDEELAIVREAVHRMVERAIKLEGTCTYSPPHHLILRNSN